MVIKDPPRTRQFELSDLRVPQPDRGAHQASRVVRVLVFVAATGFFLAYVLPGGAYDIEVRQEYGIAVWWLLGAGFAFGLLPRARPARPTVVLLVALVAYAAWTAASLGWSVSSERTTAELARALEYLGVVAVIVSVLDRATWRAAAMGLGFAALVACALAVASRLAPGAFPSNPFHGTSAASRLSYPFGYWNAVGAWASMSTAIGIAWSAHDRVRARRAAALGLVPVAVVAAYLSYSRAAMGGAALAVVAAILFSRNRLTATVHAAAAAGAAAIAILAVRNAPEIAHGTGTRGGGAVIGAIALAIAVATGAALLTSIAPVAGARIPRSVARVAVIAAIGAVVVIGAAFGTALAKKGWHDFRHPTAVQSAADPGSRFTVLSSDRYFLWRSALDAFKTKPFTGTGAGTFEYWWNQHATDSEFVRNAHSFEVENLAELGVLGLLLIVGVMAAAVALLVSVRRTSGRVTTAGASAALLAALVVYLLHASVDWMWQSTAVTVLALGCSAVAAGRLARPRRRLRWPWRVAVALAAAGAVAVQLPGLLSTAEIRRSQAAERAGNATLAYSWANAAVSAEPWAASPYEQRGLVLESARRLGPAAADLRRAISREPTNFVHRLLLSRIETESGDLAAAARDYERARRLRPQAQVFQYAPYFTSSR